MPELILDVFSLKEVVLAVSILVVFIGLAWVFHIFLLRWARKLAQKTRTKLDDIILSVLEKPVIAIIVLLGLYLSSSILPLEDLTRFYLFSGFNIVLSLLGIYTIIALVDALAVWYGREVVSRDKGSLTRRLIWFFRIGTIAAGAAVAIAAVLTVLGIVMEPVTDWVGVHGWRIAFIIILSMASILVAARFFPKIIESAVAHRVGEAEEEIKKRTDTLSRVLVNVAQVVMILVGLFMVLSELEIDIAPMLAALGVAGLAIGFGAQSMIKDLLGGLFVIMESQYHVGDVVEIGGVSGLVEDINLRRTVLRDLDGIVHVIPHGEIRVSSNFTKDWSRVNLNISVAYQEDLDRVMSVINRVGKELAEDPAWAPRILKAPQALRVDNLGSSGVDIKILGDTRPIYQWDVMGELRKRLKKAFDEEGIEIPWPHTKVYFGNAPSSNMENGGPRATN